MPRGAGTGRAALGAGAALVARPWLWPTALRLVPERWWRRWPPLPVPPASYARFRTETMYGPGGGPLNADDLIAYLKWCRRIRRRSR